MNYNSSRLYIEEFGKENHLVMTGRVGKENHLLMAGRVGKENHLLVTGRDGTDLSMRVLHTFVFMTKGFKRIDDDRSSRDSRQGATSTTRLRHGARQGTTSCLLLFMFRSKVS